MYPGSLSLESRLATWMRDQGVGADFFCALFDQAIISPSTLRQAIAGNRNLEDRYQRPIETLLSELKALAEEVAPIPIRWQNPQVFRELLAARRGKPDANLNGAKTIVVIGHVLENDGEKANVSFRSTKGVAYQRTYERGGDDISVAKFREYFPAGSDRVFCLPTKGAAEIVVGGCI